MGTDKTCIVTGAAGGIGMATVRRFVQSGHRVVACGRAGDHLERARKEWNGESRVTMAALDVTDRSAVAQLFQRFGPVQAVVACGRAGDHFERARKEWSGESRVTMAALDVTDRSAVAQLFQRFGPVQAVVVNAGICRQARLDDKNAHEVWSEVLDVNLNGAFHCMHAAAQVLGDGGSIVAVSSGLGKNGRPGYEAYCASKHGLLGLVKCVALELAPRRIRVNAVCPGWVDTAMSRADVVESARRRGVDPETLRAEAVEAIPLGRMVASEDVAGLIHWLASKDADAITGQAYNISCGEFFN